MLISKFLRPAVLELRWVNHARDTDDQLSPPHSYIPTPNNTQNGKLTPIIRNVQRALVS